MKYLFDNIVSIQVGVSIAIVLMLLFRKILKNHYVAKLRYWMWLIILIRLCIPFDLNVQFNHPAPVNVPAHDYFVEVKDSYREENTTKYEIITAEELNEKINSSYENDSDKPEENKIIVSENYIPIMDLFYSLWLIVAVVMISYFSFIYITTKDELLETVSRDERLESIFEKVKKEFKISGKVKIAMCDYVGSPMLIGYLSPVIVFPHNDYTDNEIKMILRHELTHYRRHDVLYKFLAFAVCCIYWFNPLIHIMAKYIGKDIEISCDEDSVKDCNKEMKIEYAQTILKVINMKNNKLILATNFSQSAKNVKERFTSILFSKKLKKGKPILALSMAVLIFTTSFVGCSTEKVIDNPNKQNSRNGAPYSTDYMVEIGNIDTNKVRNIFDTHHDVYEGINHNEQPFDDNDSVNLYNMYLNEDKKAVKYTETEIYSKAKNKMNGSFFTVNGTIYFYSPTSNYIFDDESEKYITVYKADSIEDTFKEFCVLKNYVQDYTNGLNVVTDGKALYISANSKTDEGVYIIKVDLSTGKTVFETYVEKNTNSVHIEGVTDDENQILYTVKNSGDYYADVFVNVYNVNENQHVPTRVYSDTETAGKQKIIKNDSLISGNYIYNINIDKGSVVKQRLGTDTIETVTENISDFTNGLTSCEIKYTFDDYLILVGYFDKGEKFSDTRRLSVNTKTGEAVDLTIKGIDAIGLDRLVRIYSMSPETLLIATNTSIDYALVADMAIITKTDFANNNANIMPIGVCGLR